MDKLIIISFTIGLIIVGGLAVYSIYLQQDESTVAIKEITTYEQTCLERWDYLRLVNQEERNYKLMADNQKLNIEFFTTSGCADSFREWMPELYSDWYVLEEFETNKKSNCESYLKGELQLDKWVEPIMREMGCEEIIKQ